MTADRRLIYRLVAFVFIILALLLAAAPSALTVGAQGGGTASEVIIAYPEAIAFPDTPDDLTLRVYFTPVDANRRAVLDPPIRSASLVLDPEDGGVYEARVSQASGPIAIILVLDASGSMARAARAMQEAAVNLVRSGPRDARYAVLRFNDQIDLLTDFTNDENRIINAIGQVTPRDRAGTCLFDATLRGIELLAANAPTGRRAVVVFTDGVDEVLGGGPCSRSSLNDVVTLASNRRLRVPLFTIGLQGSTTTPIAEAELRNMAISTGGAVAIGADLPSLFFEINNALNAQLVAEALIRPRAGDRTAQLRVLLQDGTLLQPDTTIFNSPRDFSFKTPTPTNTFTPLPPVSFVVGAPRIDPASREFIMEVSGIVSGDQIRTFRFDLITEGGLGAGSLNQNAPLPEEVRITIPDLPPQTFTIRVTALGEGGRVLSTQDVRARYEPTPTPSPTATNTPLPISAEIEEIRYEDQVAQDAILVRLLLTSPERIDHLRVTIVDRRSSFVAQDVDPVTVAPEIRISMDRVTAGEYTVNVFAVAADGRQLSRSSQEFVHTRQPTPTPSPTFTPTPVIPVVNLLPSIQADRGAQVFILNVETQNEELIRRYEVEFIDAETRISVRTVPIIVPPYNQIRVPFSDLPGGRYQIVVRGLDDDGRTIAAPSQIEFEFLPPTPTPTISPTPTSTPEPDDLIYRLSVVINDPDRRPIVLGIIGVLAFGLLLVLFVLLRRPAKAATGTGFLSEMTGAVDISKLEGYQQASKGGGSGKSAAKSSVARAKTVPSASREAPPASDVDDRTAPVPHMALPQLTLTIESSRDMPSMGKVVIVTHAPFTLGRKMRDLNFDGDDNVSRQHGEIIYENNTFYIQDNNSTHGTFVDERQVPPGTRAPIYDGAVIRLGTTTLIRVSMAGGGGGDPDKTSPEMPAYRR